MALQAAAAAAKMAKMAKMARAANNVAGGAKGKVGAFLKTPTADGMTRGQKGFNWLLYVGGPLVAFALIGLGYWLMFVKNKKYTRKYIRPSRVIPRHVSSHKEHMFNRGNNHSYKGGPERSMLVTDGNPFQAYVGVNPDGFGETRETMTKSRYSIAEHNTHDMIDHDMVEEENFSEQLKAGERMERKENNTKKRILNNSHNTGHIEHTNELEAAAELSSGNDFTQKFAMNTSKGSNVRAYIKPIQKQSTTAHILDFAQIRK